MIPSMPVLVSPPSCSKSDLLLHHHVAAAPVRHLLPLLSSNSTTRMASRASGSSQRAHSRKEIQRGRRDGNFKKSEAIERNKKIVHLGKERKWKDILTLCREESSKFNNVNYATAMSQLQRIQTANTKDPLFVEFVDTLATTIETKGLKWIGIRQISNIVHAIGKMRLKTRSAMQIIGFASRNEHATMIANHGEPQALSNVCWSLAKLGFSEGSHFFRETETRSKWLVENGNTQEIANTAWAFATLGLPSSKYFGEVEKRSKWLVENGNAQAIANTAWAFATLGLTSSTYFGEVEKRSKWLVENGNAQDTANTAWAFATLGLPSSKYFGEVEKGSKWLVENGNTQEIANTAWAFATLGVPSSKYFGEVEKRSKWLVQNGQPQDIANTAWAFARLGLPSSTYFGEVEKRSKWLVENGAPQAVANTAWAFATLGLSSPEYFGEVEKRSKWLVANGTPQNIANTAWAFATLGIKSRLFFDSCLDVTSKFAGGSNERFDIQLCYAIAILDFANEYEVKFVQLWSGVSADSGPGEISIEGWFQLVQAYEFTKAARIELKKPSMPSNELGFRDPQPSKAQRETSQLLHELGFSHAEEVSPFPIEGTSLHQGCFPLTWPAGSA